MLKALRTKTQGWLPLEHACAPSQAWTLNFLLNSKGTSETCSQGNNRQLEIHLGLPYDPVSFQWANSSQALAHSFAITFLGNQSQVPHRLSPVALRQLLSPCLVAQSPARKITWTRVVKSFLHKVKNPHNTSWPEADPFWAGLCPEGKDL